MSEWKETSEQLTDEVTDESTKSGVSRRKVVQKMLITGGVIAGSAYLPSKWTKPVLDFIVVPAHAQTSGTTTTTSTTTTLPPTSTATMPTPTFGG